MARRSGGTHKGVEEKRRSLPIYQHYTLSPGKTKSHHPEAKCNHCLKEFVCGSKQRLIRHLRKCNSISNPEQIIAETLNTLARNSATGTLNHSILEASNLLPSQIPNHHLHHQHHLQQQQQQQIVGQQQQQQLHHHPTNSTANNSNVIINNNNNIVNHHNTSGSSNDTGIIASSSNGSQQNQQLANSIPVKRSQRRGRKPANQSLASASIHVTTGLDGKTHFTPASQLPQTNIPIAGVANTSGSSNVINAAPAMIAQVHNGRQVGYTYHSASAGLSAASPVPSGAHLTSACGGATTNHHHSTGTQAYKLNSDPIDKAYLKLVLTRNLPLSLCDTKEFQLWVKTFANDYKPPSSINLVAQNLKNEAQAAKQRISNILVKAPKKTINLELHSWPEELRRHLWYAVIANVDHKRFLISIRDINMQNQHQLNNINNNNINNNNNNTTTSLSSAHQSNDITSDKVLAEFIDDCFKRIGSDRINSLIFSASSTGDSLTQRARQAIYTTHPSIVTYHCWWHFTNLLCADIVEDNPTFQHIMRNSNRLINFVNKRPKLGLSLEKFSPFAGVSSSIYQKKNDRRWYSHLVCYLLEYIKNNNEAIIRALEAATIQSQLASDNNNNSSSGAGNNTQTGIEQQTANLSTQQQQPQTILYQEDANLSEIKSIIMSPEYWTNLNLALVYLKPIHDLVALTSTVSTQPNNNNNSSILNESNVQQTTPVFSSTIANGMSLSDYMNWFLKYGKTLFDSWRQSPDDYKFQIIGRYLARFKSSISGFQLLFAAYLLNPKHRCAFMTQKAKNVAIEEILNVASEFMPEESDGHTIFDQWKLYLVREEPYDMVYEENRSTPLEWWMSLPCAESIRRVALRILRLKAFTSPKPETLFSQLYFYEDETKSSLTDTTFEDTAVLRYFYDYEDKVVQTISHQPSSTNSASNSLSSNGYHDRTQVGQLHNDHLNQSNYSSGGLSIALESNGQIDESLSSINESRQNYSESFSDVVDPYLGNHHQHPHHLTMQSQNNLGSTSNLIEDLPGYDSFIQYIDYNESGVQIVEEPIEKKKRKWTAQEILSKCQSNHQNNNNNDINSK